MRDLNDRQRRILARLVAEYIDQGEPVSSAWLADHSDLGLSSATVRSILARLEEQGFVRQPHTSAGRVPTDSGYRLYVDSLLGSRKRARTLPDVEARLRQSGTVGDLLENVSHELSRASHHVGFALAPAMQAARLRHIDFVSLEGRRVLVVVVTTGGHITHKVVESDERCDSVVLTQAANYINEQFAGLTLHEIRTALVARMQQERMLYDALVARALKLARTGLDEGTPDEALHVQGASFLLDELFEDQAEREVTLETLRALFRMIERSWQRVVMGVLTVVIGSEHASPDMQPFSLVASTFTDGEWIGAVGVIGPTRMRYQRAIAVVDSMSAAMSRVFDRDTTDD